MARTKTVPVVLSTRSGLRKYRVSRERLERDYLRITPGREQARDIRLARPQFRYGQSYFVKKTNAWHVAVYGIAKVANSTDYAFVGEWDFYIRARNITEQSVLKTTFETFEDAGYILIRRYPKDRVSLSVGVRGIDYERGMDLLRNLTEYREALEAKIAELDPGPPSKHAAWRAKSHHVKKAES